MRRKPKTSAQIVADALELARKFYASHGYEVPEGFKFYESRHPQERGMWSLATIAYEHFDGTDLDDVLTDLED